MPESEPDYGGVLRTNLGKGWALEQIKAEPAGPQALQPGQPMSDKFLQAVHLWHLRQEIELLLRHPLKVRKS